MRKLGLNKKQILKTWREIGTDVIQINRKTIDRYHEQTSELVLQNVEGYYSKGKNLVSINYTENASTNMNYNETFSVICDDMTLKIKRLDTFILKDITYKIVDVENVANVYLNLTLEREV